jgi:hypothetical protein
MTIIRSTRRWLQANHRILPILCGAADGVERLKPVSIFSAPYLATIAARSISPISSD